MSELRDRLELLVEQAPPPRERFEDDLWERIGRTERSRRGRWRVAMVAIATVAVASVGAAEVLAVRGGTTKTTIDRTISCQLRTSLSSASFFVSSSVTEPGPYGGGSLWVGLGNATYAGVGKSIVPHVGAKPVSGYYLDDGDCAASHATAPLSGSGLRSLGVFSNSSRSADMRESCSVASNSTITVHLRVTLSKPGVPASAELAIRGGKRPHPIAFVSWTPSMFRAYVAAGCEQS